MCELLAKSCPNITTSHLTLQLVDAKVVWKQCLLQQYGKKFQLQEHGEFPKYVKITPGKHRVYAQLQARIPMDANIPTGSRSRYGASTRCRTDDRGHSSDSHSLITNRCKPEMNRLQGTSSSPVQNNQTSPLT